MHYHIFKSTHDATKQLFDALSQKNKGHKSKTTYRHQKLKTKKETDKQKKLMKKKEQTQSGI